ncbi:MAG: glycosyltransferase [Arcanobacterium sp.]|nr:glycosyltransferase [Arcanobacterium sp.]
MASQYSPQAQPRPPKVCAVVVAYNRAELLQECLDALASQTRTVDAIIVINNASTDASEHIATTHPAVCECVTLPRNTGGAGGFAAGIARAAYHWDADFVWIMDDDTIPRPDALGALLKTQRDYPGQPAILASKAVWIDGREHPMNRPRVRPMLSRKIASRASAVGAQPIRSASFVSIMIDARAVHESGLPKAAYFLWNDDFEYTTRVLRRRTGLYVPTSVVEHRTKAFGNAASHPGSRFRLEVRNKLWMFSRSHSLNPIEKVLYGGKTTLRWISLFARTSERIELARYAKAGAEEAAIPPVPTEEIFARTPLEFDVIHAERMAHLDPNTTRYAPGEVPQFAVLMSVYAGDNPAFLQRSLESISVDQSLKPAQIMLVQDGPVTSELGAVIRAASSIAQQEVTVLRFDENRGLAAALDDGLRACDYDIVARQDADDISVPFRFELQIPFMKDLDILGSALTEFDTDPRSPGLVRTQPTKHRDILRAAKLRDPFNHPTVVFRKGIVEGAGGYKGGGRMEDYWLFARMLQSNARVANLPDSLVYYRVGSGAYERRGGRGMTSTEFHMQMLMYSAGFTNTFEFLRNLVVRVPYRLVPARFRERIYHRVGKRLWFNR